MRYWWIFGGRGWVGGGGSWWFCVGLLDVWGWSFSGVLWGVRSSGVRFASLFFSPRLPFLDGLIRAGRKQAAEMAAKERLAFSEAGEGRARGDSGVGGGPETINTKREGVQYRKPPPSAERLIRRKNAEEINPSPKAQKTAADKAEKNRASAEIKISPADRNRKSPQARREESPKNALQRPS